MINFRGGKKVYKYALTVVDVASRYKAAEAITSKESDEVARGFAKIYRHGPMKWPQMLQVDPTVDISADTVAVVPGAQAMSQAVGDTVTDADLDEGEESVTLHSKINFSLTFWSDG